MRNQESMSQNQFPLPWNKALIAIIPGLIATMGMITTDFSASMLVGLILLAIFLIAVFWEHNRQLPSWGLMAIGMLTSIGLTIASGLVGGLTAILVGQSVTTIVLLIFGGLLIVLLRFSWQHQRVPQVVWGLITLIVLCQLAVRLKYFTLPGVSWSVAVQWLNISLYAVVMALLLPVALGQIMAKKHGLLAILFTIGMIYVNFQILIDVNSKVSDHVGDSFALVAYKALIPLIFTIAAPLWFLRASTPRRRVGGMLTLIGSAVIIDLLIVGWSYAGELPAIIWISFIPYTFSVLLALVLAYLLFQESGKRPVMVGGAIADPAPNSERSMKLSLHSAPEYPGHCHWHRYT
jgi:hypothetical protein